MYLPSLTGPMRPTPLNDQVAGPLKFLRQVRDSMTFMRYANPPGCHGVYLVSALTRLDKRYPPKTEGTPARSAPCWPMKPTPPVLAARAAAADAGPAGDGPVVPAAPRRQVPPSYTPRL